MTTQPLTVLHIASGDLWAGAEVQLFYLCRELAKRGVSVRALLFNEGQLAQKLRAAAIPVVVLDERRLNGLQLMRALAAELRKLTPIIIHTHGHKENILAGIANYLTIRAASVRTTHGGQETTAPFWRLHNHALNWLNSFTGKFLQDAVVAVSQALGTQLASTFGAAKIHVIENAIDLEYIEGLAQLASPIEPTRQCINIAIVGRLVRVKRHDLLLQALAIGKIDSDWHLYVIGDGPLRAHLQQLSCALKLQDRVSFTGAIDPIYPLLKRMSFIVMPSDHEGLPMTLLEAMTLKVPVIAHAVGGIPDVIGRDGAGILVHDHSPHGYSDAITRLINSPSFCTQLAGNAYQRANEYHDIAKKITAYIALYTALTTGKKL